MMCAIFKPCFGGGIEIDVDVALRINHGGDPFRANQIRSVRQTAQKEVLDQMAIPCRCPPGISNRSR